MKQAAIGLMALIALSFAAPAEASWCRYDCGYEDAYEQGYVDGFWDSREDGYYRDYYRSSYYSGYRTYGSYWGYGYGTKPAYSNYGSYWYGPKTSSYKSYSAKAFWY